MSRVDKGCLRKARKNVPSYSWSNSSNVNSRTSLTLSVFTTRVSFSTIVGNSKLRSFWINSIRSFKSTNSLCKLRTSSMSAVVLISLYFFMRSAYCSNNCFKFINLFPPFICFVFNIYIFVHKKYTFVKTCNPKLIQVPYLATQLHDHEKVWITLSRKFPLNLLILPTTLLLYLRKLDL